jgi:hypothetical protein
MTAVEWLFQELDNYYQMKSNVIKKEILKQAKEMEKQQGYSEEEVLPLLEMLQKCKEYFLLKTDLKSEERADAIGQVLENFKNK